MIADPLDVLMRRYCIEAIAGHLSPGVFFSLPKEDRSSSHAIASLDDAVDDDDGCLGSVVVRDPPPHSPTGLNRHTSSTDL